MRDADAGCVPTLLRSAATLLLVLWGCEERSLVPENGKPAANVLLVVVDTLRADALHCYGSGAPVSPAVDAIAQEGALFERAIAASSYTAPSHASIMTSLYPRQHSLGYGNGTLRLEREKTLAWHLQQAGYETAAFVSNPVLERGIGLDRGFALYDDELGKQEPNRPSNFERAAHDTTRRALGWLTDRDTPFFLWVHYQEPHGPYTPPAPLDVQFTEKGVSETEKLLPILTGQHGRGGIPAYQHLPGLRRTSEYRARYRGEIRSLDDSIGQLVAAARATGPTFVILTADHGEAFGENDFYMAHGHACTPDQSHIPLIVAGPGVVAQRRAEPVGHVDLMPTVLDLVGLSPPVMARGRSLRDALIAGAALPVRTYFCDAGFELAAYREDRFVRARGLPWSPGLDERYKSGRANRKGMLMSDEQISAVETFRWERTDIWQPLPDVDEPLAREIVAYSRERTGDGKAVEISPEQLERLRALGYASP